MSDAEVNGGTGLIGRTAFAAILILSLAWAPSAFTQSELLERPDPNQPVALVADQISFDNELGIVTADGSVEVYYGDRTLTADRIVYDDRTGRISATGQIVIRDPSGTTVYADAADLDAELRDGIVLGAQSVLAENVRLAAVEGQRIDGRYNALSKVVYSPCYVCAENPTPLWRIRARRVIHDDEARIIHYENATFDVLGVPIAWLPYFRHPDPTVERASGFLTPSFLSSSTYGYGLKVPLFWVIDDQSDLTFEPFFTTNDGLIMQGEYRHVFVNGGFEIAGSIGYNDYDGDDRVRGHLDTEGEFRVFDDVVTGWNVNFASDDGYLRRFDFSSADRLTSELFVGRYRTSGFFDASALYFQSLRDNEPAGTIPVALPAFEARQDYPEFVLGGDLGVFVSGHTLVRNNGRDAARFSLGMDYERDAVLPWGLALSGFSELRGDVFISQDDPNTDDFTARLTGLIGGEARFPLIWDGEGSDVHVIEPVVQIVLAPATGNDASIPFEDSLVTEFDETNVIDRNHFSGLDNVEEGGRINLALRYQALIGEVAFDASVGRVYRFEAAPEFTAGSGLATTESDFVTFWQASWDPYVKVSHRMRFSDDATITRNEFFGTLDLDPIEFAVAYTFFESDAAIGSITDREEINAEALLQLHRNWSLGAFMQRDLQLGEFVRVGGQLTYENECCAVDVFLRRRFTDSEDAPASTSVGVRVRLLTLGAGKDT